MADTLNISGVTFNVVYVDPSLATAGDGTTPAGALKLIGTPVAGNAYIVRRLDGTSSSVTTASLTSNLAVIGMAKPGTPEYALMPAAAKSAWGSDAGSYACLSMAAAAASMFTLSSAAYVGYFHGLQFSGSSSTADAFFINLSCRSACVVTNCKFLAGSTDLSLESYTSSPTESGAATMGGVSITGYMAYNTGYSGIRIQDCIFCSVGSGTNYKRHPIYITGASGLQASIVNNTFYTAGLLATSYGSYSYMGVYINTTATSAPANPLYQKTIRICGNTVNLLMRGTGAAQAIPISWYISANLEPLMFTNNTVQISSRRLGGSTYGTVTQSSYTANISAPQLFMDNNTFNLSSTDWTLTLSQNVVDISYNTYAPSRLARIVSYINNLTVNVSSVGGESVTVPTATYIALRLYWSASAIDGLLVVSNVTVAADKRRALTAQYCYFNGGISLTGAVTTTYCIGRIASISSAQYCNALLSTSADQLVVDTITGNATGYTGTEYLLSGAIYTSYLYVGAVNLPLRNLTPVGSSSYGQAFSVSSSSYVTANRYTIASYGLTCDTVAVARTTGASSTLLFSGYCTGYTNLTISPDGFAGIAVTPAQTGANLLTMYGLIATGYTEVDAAWRIKLSIVVTLSNGTKIEYDSHVDGQCLADASTWGATGVGFKLTLPFAVPSGASAVLSIEYHNPTSGLTIYLDPTRYITAI